MLLRKTGIFHHNAVAGEQQSAQQALQGVYRPAGEIHRKGNGYLSGKPRLGPLAKPRLDGRIAIQAGRAGNLAQIAG